MTDDGVGSDIRKGLAGVVVDTTAISKVNPDTNSLLYRGYPVQELAAECSMEQVAWLLWTGELPTAAELAAFATEERAGRALDPRVRTVLEQLPTTAHPMDTLRTAVSAIGAADPDAADDSPAAELAKAKRLFAAIPAVVAFEQRRRRGATPVDPRDDLDWSANLLWMTFGTEPTPEAVDAFRISAILYAEHSFNASTFTARVITSTLADLHAAVTGAIGALKGPLHGGANEQVMHTFDEIVADAAARGEDVADRARGWLAEALAAKRKIMGFGHRVYKQGDSRVPTMHAAFLRLAEHHGDTELVRLSAALEQAMDEAKGIKPNLDYPSGPAYRLLGFDTETFTPLFVAARVTGWTAHIMEQRGANALIRPLSAYAGPAERHVDG